MLSPVTYARCFSARGTADLLLVADGVEGAAAFVEPGAGFAPVGIAAFDLFPEPVRVVHFLDVRDLVRCDIVERKRGCADQAPGEVQATFGAA